MGRHSSRRTPHGRRLAPVLLAPVLVALAVVAAVPTLGWRGVPAPKSPVDVAVERSPSIELDPAGPCQGGYRELQVTGEPVPGEGDVRDIHFTPLPRVGVVEEGICLGWAYELSAPGWKVTRVTTVARKKRAEFSSSLSGSSKDTSLYLPEKGCFRVTWTFQLTGPGHTTGSWTVRSVHGQGCDRYGANSD